MKRLPEPPQLFTAEQMYEYAREHMQYEDTYEEDHSLELLAWIEANQKLEAKLANLERSSKVMEEELTRANKLISQLNKANALLKLAASNSPNDAIFHIQRENERLKKELSNINWMINPDRMGQ